MTRRKCFLVAPLPKAAWEAVLLTLIPLAASVERNVAPGVRPLFIFRKGVPQGAVNALKILSSTAPVKLDDIMCFDTLLMTATYSRMNDREHRSAAALEGDVAPLRRRKPVGEFQAGMIALSENLWDAIEYRIRERFPDCTIVRVGASDSVSSVAAAVAPAALLVGDHITSLIHMVWLNGGRVLDLSADEYACNAWAEAFAAKIEVPYQKIVGVKSCVCANWSCYPARAQAPAVLEYDVILAEIGKALSAIRRTEAKEEKVEESPTP
jgi:hypothetical protein